MKKWLPWITGAVIIGGLVWSFFYLKDMNPLGPLSLRLGQNKPEGVSIRFKNAKLVGRSDGKKVWTFQAKAVEVSKDRRLATFHGITSGSLLQDGKQVASLSAKKVFYNTITRNVTVPDGAEFKLKEGPAFRVRDILWNAGESTLICKNGIDVEMAEGTLHGERMTAYIGKKELVIQKVKGQIKLEE